MDDHRGHIVIGERQHGATLSETDGKLELHIALAAAEDLELPAHGIVHFRAATGYFTLLGLRQIGSQMLFGVGSSITVSVRHAIKSANFTAREDIGSDTWLLYIEDFPQILHVTGFQNAFSVGTGGVVHVQWSYAAAPALVLNCPRASLTITAAQDFSTSSQTRDSATMTFAYPLKVVFSEPVDLYDALPTLHRIRQFCSLLLGRVLNIDRIVLRLPQEDGRPHDADVLGVRPVRRLKRPERRIVDFDGPDAMALLLDAWLSGADAMEEVIGLHFQGLEQEDLSPTLRFQLFVQAIEAAHRRSGAAVGTSVDIEPIADTLKEKGVAGDVIDRVTGILAHAHEPGLRQRLKSYWEAFEAELAVIRPSYRRKGFVSRLVATRNYYAHRTDLTPDVLQDADLWDATEFVKAISHLVILQMIGAEITGVGQRMLEERFVRFAIQA